jgi:hypothetical protein
MRWFFALASAALLLAACATPQSRIERHPAIYEKLSPAEKQLAGEGRIKEGFSEDAVFIALGNPSKKRTRQIDGKEEVRWIYGRLESHPTTVARVRPMVLRNGHVVYYTSFEPGYDSSYVDVFEVVFRNGKVVGWGDL